MRLVRRGTKQCVPFKSSSSSLFRPGVKLVVRRASLFGGAAPESCSSNLYRKFQRPFSKRRVKDADHALKRSSLGQRRRMNGMQKLLARAGRGLSYKLPTVRRSDHSGTDESESEEEEEEEDRPFEPLQVWTSPHSSSDDNNDSNKEEAPATEFQHSGVGLPATVVTQLRPNEYGIEEPVRVVQPAPLSAYSKHHVFVPAVLAKWLRPHQREGVQFMYQCVMGLQQAQFPTIRGCILADGACVLLFCFCCCLSRGGLSVCACWLWCLAKCLWRTPSRYVQTH